MAKLENVITVLARASAGREQAIAPAAMVAVTLVYLVAVLSVPLYSPHRLVWLAIYPIVASEMNGDGYWRVLIRSLWILPIVAMIGTFNPILERSEAFSIGGIAISFGWVSFFSILLRGLLSMQSVLIMISAIGFYDFCDTLRRSGCPAVLTTQMLLTYRYISVLVEEALVMRRAREARGYGRCNYPLRMWGTFVGQLLIRSIERAGRIHRAMLARGYDGRMPTGAKPGKMNGAGWTYLIIWTILIIACRLTI